MSADEPAARWIVLLTHGSRDDRWRQPFELLRQSLVERASQAGTPADVSLAYLQWCEPTLEQCLEACRNRGARRVVVVPVFMSGGGHLLRDVPLTVARAGAALEGLEVRTTGALCEEPEVMEAMALAVLRLMLDSTAQHHNDE